MGMNPVYLVRHAAAEPAALGGDDARPLTRSGRASFEALARRLSPRLRLARVWTSPARRARETADILAAVTSAEVVVAPELACGRSDGRELLVLLGHRGGGSALVGHNPEVGEAIALALGGPREVRPGTVVALEPSGEGYELVFLEAPGQPI
jgi:phosphohistidine phosphatase